jgi:hypothetical protein
MSLADLRQPVVTPGIIASDAARRASRARAARLVSFTEQG